MENSTRLIPSPDHDSTIAGHLRRCFLRGVLLLVAALVSLQAEAVAQLVAPPAMPPGLKQEVIVPEPSPAYVWIPGAWEWAGSQWVWAPGKWMIPPHPSLHWVAGYWQVVNGAYQWQEGHWAYGEMGMIVTEPVPVPPLVTNVVAEPPASGGVWVPGRWEWRGGQWVWLAGYYAQPPQPTARWVPGQWAPGELGFWRWLPGHWQVS